MSAIAQFRTQGETSADGLIWTAAVEACPESLAIMEGGRVLCANRAFAKMFGYALAAEVQGRALAEFVSQDPDAENPPARYDGIAPDNPAGEFIGTRKDDSRIRVKTSSAQFRAGNLDLLVVSARDVSKQTKSARQVRESQKMEAVGRLLGGVAHDFNNLITGIMLYCDLLMAGLPSESRLQHHAHEIRMAGAQGAALIQQLLAVARPQVIEARALSVNAVVRDMRDLLARLIGENIELATALAADLGWVKTDPTQVQQIILNLVLNARDAMPQGGRVTLKTRNCADFLPDPHNQKSSLTPCIEFTVMDTGCGMNAETRSRLFEPFFTTKRPGQGNGLGLSTAFDIVNQAGGTIVVESEPGRGTQVFVRLPRVKQESTQKTGSANRKRGDTP